MYKYSEDKVMLGEQIVKDYGDHDASTKLVGEAYAKLLNDKQGLAEEKEALTESSEEAYANAVNKQAMSKRAY